MVRSLRVWLTQPPFSWLHDLILATAAAPPPPPLLLPADPPVPDLLRGGVLGLRHEEEDDGGAGHAAGRVQEVGPVGADGLLQVRLELGDDEGAQPVEGAGHRGGDGAGLRKEDLGVDGEGQRAQT